MNGLIPQLSSVTPAALYKQPVEHIKVEKPIHIYNYEGSGHCRYGIQNFKTSVHVNILRILTIYSRFVRETLDMLEIPYISHNLGFGSPKRKEFEAMSGKMQFPYLVDENTGKRMFESTDIVRYLYETYAPRLKKE